MKSRKKPGEEFGNVGMSDRSKRILEKRRQKKFAKFRRRATAESIEFLVARYDTLDAIDTAQYVSFSKFPLSKPTQRGLEENSFLEPTEIQRDSLPLSLRGVDVVGAAKTGSGKTLAFLIPILECLWRQRWSRTTDGLGALVITPTRELAYQIFHVLNKVGAHHHFSAALLIGGNNVEFEKDRVGTVNIVISTPGRLLQHMDENTTFNCDQLQMLVIDEADRILDLGFESQMNAIMSNLPSKRQTLLFSATQTKSVKELTRLALQNPVYVSVHENASEATPSQLHQARFLTKAFCHLRPGLSLSGLWGTMKQSKRLEVFEAFNRKTFAAAMIATDLASRGLDFARVDWVLQLDCPATVEDYIHRVGRTARMDAKGEAVLVLTPSQEEAMVARLTAKKIPLNKISVDPKQMVDISNKLQSVIIQFQELKKFAQQSFLAFIRSTYLMQYKDVFDVRSIDMAALARSYGLSTAPRVRFLARAAQKDGKKNSSEKIGRGSVEERKEKTLSELVEMMKKTSRSHGQDRTDGASDDVDGELDQIKNAEVLETAVEKNLLLGSKDDSSNDDDDELLKITKRDIFQVLGPAPPGEEVLTTSKIKKLKPISRQAAAKLLLKKGVSLNVKKVFTDDEKGHDELENKNAEKFDIEEAKQEMAEIDKLDKAAYKEKLKKWRQEKKAKQKKRLEKEKLLNKGGAVLDFGENEESAEEPDLSWLPDPDKPKKYDAHWNEISDEYEEDMSAAIVDEVNNNNDEDVQPMKKRMKTVSNLEKEALKLLGAD